MVCNCVFAEGNKIYFWSHFNQGFIKEAYHDSLNFIACSVIVDDKSRIK